MSTSKSAAKDVRTKDIRMPDGSTSSVRLFDANSETSASPHKPLIVIWPGFGMGARYYDPIALELAARGYPTATGELRGQGSSTAVASRKKTWGYHDLASQDYPTTVRAAKKELGLAEDHPTLLLCHSMGGQIASLFLARPEAEMLNVQGMIGVGAGTPYYKSFSGDSEASVAVWCSGDGYRQLADWLLAWRQAGHRGLRAPSSSTHVGVVPVRSYQHTAQTAWSGP
ncbi:alpha/beta fold hydrolase [Corynebacterium dentalis]|uniref:alpha/beta fold hydrolase n=1 Tax=Corynebacterium dentalis TaxID=2014528 RepID=UPI00370DA075